MGLGEVEPEDKVAPPPYGGQWTTTTSAGGSESTGKHSPSSDLSREFASAAVAPLESRYGRAPGTTLSMSDQASWNYMAAQEQHSGASSAATVPARDSPDAADGFAVPHAAPPYQNWAKPPSDNGTATTSSTECSALEAAAAAAAAAANGVVVAPLRPQRRYSVDDGLDGQNYSYGSPDPTTLSLSPSFMSERRRRQESLV